MFGLYANPKSVKKLSTPHASNSWLEEFKSASSSKDSLKLKQLRVKIMSQTLSAFNYKSYLLEDNTEIILDSKIYYGPKNTKLYTKDSNIKEKKNNFQTKLFVLEGDCLEIGLHFQNEYSLKTAVLNMANESHPGGGYLKGSGAQEENLHRRTNLFQCLEDPLKVKNSKYLYPIPRIGGIFSPEVCVIRSSEFKGYAFFTQPQYISFLTVAAVQFPKLIEKGTKMIEKDEILNKERMRIIFNMSLDNDIECVVLSAFGCGAFENPPEIIAKLFKEVISEYENQFKMIVFAIYEDHNSNKKHNKQGNLKPFADCFGTKSMTLSEFSKSNL